MHTLILSGQTGLTRVYYLTKENEKIRVKTGSTPPITYISSENTIIGALKKQVASDFDVGNPVIVHRGCKLVYLEKDSDLETEGFLIPHQYRPYIELKVIGDKNII